MRLKGDGTNSGRIPDSQAKSYIPYTKLAITLPPELMERVTEYCNEEERTRSWTIQKALDAFLEERGY